eukprot:263561-Hanusia_phi.AAC.1
MDQGHRGDLKRLSFSTDGCSHGRNGLPPTPPNPLIYPTIFNLTTFSDSWGGKGGGVGGGRVTTGNQQSGIIWY